MHGLRYTSHMNSKNRKRILLGCCILVLIICLAFITKIPEVIRMFSQVVTVQTSVVFLLGFAIINFLLIINFLYTIHTKNKTILENIEKEKRIDRAKNEFIALISHQLRTPLSAINWYTEALSSEDMNTDTKKQKEYLENLHTSNQRMTSLVNSIVDVSRIELGTFITDAKQTALFPLVENTLEGFKGQLESKKITINKNYDEKLCTILIDGRYLRMVLEQLISNAIKYMPANGTIDLTVECKEDIHITVTDTGYGIPEAELSRVFSKLFRASNILDKEPNGTGIGLYIVKSIVEYAGGKISVESKENVGTTFYVTLPTHAQ
jgi:signal transduction histidine kinase